jgi:hypothetical protein
VTGFVAQPDSSSRSGRRWVTFFVFWASLSLLSSIWAVAMPLATGPDEPEHFVKAASVVRGELVGLRSSAGYVVDVPEYVAFTHDQLCTSFKPEKTADCAPSTPSDASEQVSSTTTAGSYNPLYYAAVGWPTLIAQDVGGLYAMRIVSGILVSAFLALAVMLLSTWRRRTVPLLGLAVATTPMVVYLSGVVNPNSLEIAATLVVLVAALSVVLRPDPGLLVERATILAVAAAVASNMRGISPLWVAIAALVPLVLVAPRALRPLIRQKPVWIAASVVLLTAVVSLLWTVLGPSLSPGFAPEEPNTAPPADYDNVGSSPVFGFIKMVGLSFDFVQDLVGRMGWYDTVLPIGTYLVWSALFIALAGAAFVLLRRRLAVFALLLLAAFVLGPALVQAVYITQGGFIWQARYALPIFVCLIVGLAVAISESVEFTPGSSLRRLTTAVVFLWSFNQVVAFLHALRRYAVGESGSYAAIFRNPDWAPPLGTVPVMVAAVVTLGVLGILFLRVARPEQGSSPLVSPGAPPVRASR